MLTSQTKWQKNKLVLAFALFLGVFLCFFASIRTVEAHLYGGYSSLSHQDPIPGFRSPPCDQESNPEFHSLRPYQTSPCGESPKTYYCFNNYNLLEGLYTQWDPATCTPGGTYWQCAVDQEIEKVYVIDGEYARFPIMGNTEQVTNSQGP